MVSTSYLGKTEKRWSGAYACEPLNIQG